MASIDCTKATGKRDEKRSGFGIWWSYVRDILLRSPMAGNSKPLTELSDFRWYSLPISIQCLLWHSMIKSSIGTSLDWPFPSNQSVEILQSVGLTQHFVFCLNRKESKQITTRVHTVLINYIPRIIQTLRALLRFVVVGHHIMTSSNGNLSRVTVSLCRESTGHRWNSITKGH